MKNLDLLQNEIGLMIDGNDKKKSTFGAILTIFIIILTIISIMVFGEDMIKKINPKSSYSKNFQELNNLNFSGNFPLMVTLVQRGAKKLPEHEKYFDISFYNIFLSQNVVNDTVPFTKRQYLSGNCKKEDLNGYYEDFNSVISPTDIDYFYCLKQNQKIEIFGTIGQRNNTYMAILINKCINSTSNFSNINNSNDKTEIICKSPKEIEDALENIFISIYTIDYYVDVSDYVNPAKPYVRNQIIPISFLIYKRQYIYYKNIDIVTDKGWIFPENLVESKYQLDFTNSEIFFSRSVAFTPDTVSEITIAISRLKDVYKRSYYKIQNLAADVGGILKSILVISFFLNYYANRPIIEEDLFFSLFSSYNLDKNELNDFSEKIKNVKIKEKNINTSKNKNTLDYFYKKIKLENIKNLNDGNNISSSINILNNHGDSNKYLPKLDINNINLGEINLKDEKSCYTINNNCIKNNFIVNKPKIFNNIKKNTFISSIPENNMIQRLSLDRNKDETCSENFKNEIFTHLEFIKNKHKIIPSINLIKKNKNDLNYFKVIFFFCLRYHERQKISYVNSVLAKYLDVKNLLKHLNSIILLKNIFLEDKSKIISYLKDNPLL